MKNWTCEVLSSVDYVKYVAKFCGWQGKKEDKDRRLLSELKRIITEWDDGILEHLKWEIDRFGRIAGDNGVLVFVDSREPEEIERFKKIFNAQTLLIKRDSADDGSYSNPSDTNVFNYDYDYELPNNFTLDKLNEMAVGFSSYILNYGSEYKQV